LHRIRGEVGGGQVTGLTALVPPQVGAAGPIVFKGLGIMRSFIVGTLGIVCTAILGLLAIELLVSQGRIRLDSHAAPDGEDKPPRARGHPKVGTAEEMEREYLPPGRTVQQAFIQKLKPGTLAPTLTLDKADGSGRICLEQLRGGKPVVLVFGSFSCNAFVSKISCLEQTYQTYKDQAEFFFVYIDEAHPEMYVLVPQQSGEEKMVFPTTNSMTERIRRALLLKKSTNLSMPAATSIDEDALERDFGPWPTRIMVIEPSGQVAFNSGMGDGGSGGLNTSLLDQWLKEHLLSAASTAGH
jgi:hypothetical protein